MNNPSRDLVAELALCDCTALEAAPVDPVRLRQALKDGDRRLDELFDQGHPIDELVQGRAQLVDRLLRAAYRAHMNEREGIALLAVGGYGRGELHPRSDVDLLILLADAGHADPGELETLVNGLWDLGLDIGHSVRTLEECVREAERDITVATNLMESRHLAGDAALHPRLEALTGPDKIWPSRRFFQAKWREQQQRHHKFHDTAYKLEPNVKEGPGGLRDIQMIGWVSKRHFRARRLGDLVRHGFLTEQEYRDLKAGQDFLWRVRYALHKVAGRREDRLLFDLQKAVAERLGYRDQPLGDLPPARLRDRPADGPRLGVELFMKDYFRQVMTLSRLNEMLLQHYQEAILHPHGGDPVPLNRRFQVRHGFLEARDETVFQRHPLALLELFLLLQQHPHIQGVRAQTIRWMRANLHRIDNRFRADLGARTLFMEILRQPAGITAALRRMNRYGVLAAYIPAFAHVVGQAQFDLFHIYTVDEHSLFVVRNLRRFGVPEFAREFPLCTRVARRIPKPELLYLAGLFHDIGKGRGGDHSQIGAQEAADFCRRHDLSPYDTQLVAWLVQHHLLMSKTAQHEDISDPQVINRFATAVGDQVRLDYLYLLTVADMRATNPEIWNSWKDALLRQLYLDTRRALERGLENPLDRQERIHETQARARRLLAEAGLDEGAVQALWARLEDDYFLHNAPEQVARHTRHILGAPRPGPVVRVDRGAEVGGCEVFVHTPVRPDLFARLTLALERLGLDVQEARIHTSRDGQALDSFILADGPGLPDDEEIIARLRAAIDGPPPDARKLPRMRPRRLKAFHHPLEVSFVQDEANQRTLMSVTCTDRPGVLARVALALLECGADLHAAKIATFGERVEDVFFLSDRQGRPLYDPTAQDCLRARLAHYLED